jgi:ATP-dependent Clp protease ATP-binding subunit ClpA
MFERFTEKARRVVFFARYEASQFGSPCIESEHLLLGLLREDKALTYRFLRPSGTMEAIRKAIEQHTAVREKIHTSVDLPLSNESKRVLAYAAEEAERLLHKHIGTEHLLLGLLREEKCFGAQVLRDHEVHLERVREELRGSPHGLRNLRNVPGILQPSSAETSSATWPNSNRSSGGRMKWSSSFASFAAAPEKIRYWWASRVSARKPSLVAWSSA